MLLQIIILPNTKNPHNFFHVIFTELRKNDLLRLSICEWSHVMKRRWFIPEYWTQIEWRRRERDVIKTVSPLPQHNGPGGPPDQHRPHLITKLGPTLGVFSAHIEEERSHCNQTLHQLQLLFFSQPNESQTFLPSGDLSDFVNDLLSEWELMLRKMIRLIGSILPPGSSE